MLSDPDTMDTRADRTHSFNKNKGSRGRVTTTTPAKDTNKQCKEGCCFHCDKQGHISQNCPKKKKEETKACKAETENSDQESEAELTEEEEDLKEFGRTVSHLRKAMTDQEKMELILGAIKGEGDDGDISESGF